MVRTVSKFLVLAAAVLVGQTYDTSNPVISDPRPLARVADFLEAKYGWRITYEDPVILYPGDFTDITAQVRRSGSGPPIYAARRGRIDMRDVLPPVLSAKDDPAVLLQRAIELHNSGGGVGVFRVLRTGDTFHVIPSKIKDVDGKVLEATPLLDTAVTIPEQERTVGETVSAITDAISLATSVTVRSTPMFMRHSGEKIVFGASNEPARSALLRLFDSSGNKTTSWLFLCGAGERHCTLNVIDIRVEVEAPDGTKKRVPLAN